MVLLPLALACLAPGASRAAETVSAPAGEPLVEFRIKDQFDQLHTSGYYRGAVVVVVGAAVVVVVAGAAVVVVSAAAAVVVVSPPLSSSSPQAATMRANAASTTSNLRIVMLICTPVIGTRGARTCVQSEG